MQSDKLESKVSEAKKVFEDGDYEGCIAILSEDELNNDYFSKTKHTKNEVSLFIKAHALAIEALMKTGDSPEVIEEIERRYEIVAHEAEEHEVEVDEIKKYGVFEYRQENDEKAEQLFDKVLEIYTRLAESDYEKYEPDIARSYNNLANLYSETQRIEEAESLFRKAIDIQERLVETRPGEFESDLAKSYGNLALLYHECQEFDEAESTYLTAISYFEESNPMANGSTFAIIFLNMANLYRDLEQKEKEAECLIQAIDIYKELVESDKTYESNLERCLARLERIQSIDNQTTEGKTMGKKDVNEELRDVLDFWKHGPATAEEVKSLLDRGADPMFPGDGNKLLLFDAIHQQSSEIVKILIDHAAGVSDLIKTDSDYSFSVLSEAVNNDDCSVLSMLIKDYNAIRPSAMMLRYLLGLFLLKFVWGVKLESCFDSFESLCTFLKELFEIDDQMLFWCAIRGGYVDFCKYLNDKKDISLELETEEGEDAIHLASSSFGSLGVLKWLVEEVGLSPESENSKGMQPIHSACDSSSCSCFEQIRYLINECNIDPDVPSEDGMCPIHYVARTGDFDLISTCVEEFGFDFDLDDGDGGIPLDYTIANNAVDATQYLVELYGEEGVQKAYEIAFAMNELEYVEFLSEDCGFDLKKEKWVEVYEYEDEEREWETTTMKKLLYKNNAEIYKYCFEKHYGKKLPKVESIPFADIYSTHAYSIIDYLLSRYNPRTYLDCLVEDDYQSPWGAFCEAARLNDIGLLKYLVEKKKVTLEDCRHGDSSMDTEPLFPIHAAIKNGNLDMVKYLVEECKANPVESSYNNGSTILYAAQENQIEIADYLIEVARNRGILNACHSVILAFVEEGKYKKALEYVEKYGADVNALVCHFSQSCHKKMVGFLKKVYAKYDVDLTYKDEDGNTALLNSLYNGSFEIFKWLVEDCGQKPGEVMEEGRNALILAARAENPELIRYLVEKCNLDVNSKDSKGNTAVIYAINGRNLSAEENCEIIHYLVKRGADINSQDSDKENILHYIARNSFYDIEEFEKFIEEGADFMVKNRDLKTPLHIAAEAGRLDIVQSLIENHNVDPNLQCRDKATPAHLAAKSNQTEVVEWLIENGYTKVNRKDKDGDSILRYAVIGFCNSPFNDDESYLELVRWLLENGADCNSMNCFGITSLHEAAEQGNLIAVKYFIEECGMDPSIGKDKPCGTPAQYSRGERTVVRYLHKKEKEWEARHAD